MRLQQEKAWSIIIPLGFQNKLNRKTTTFSEVGASKEARLNRLTRSFRFRAVSVIDHNLETGLFSRSVDLAQLLVFLNSLVSLQRITFKTVFNLNSSKFRPQTSKGVVALLLLARISYLIKVVSLTLSDTNMVEW